MNNKITQNILNVKIDFGMTYDDVVSEVAERLGMTNVDSAYICTVNPEFIVEAQQDTDFRDILNKSFLSVADGAGVLYAQKYYEALHKKGLTNKDKSAISLLKKIFVGLSVGFSIKDFKYVQEYKVTGSNLIYKLSQLASEKNYNVFFLGGWGKDLFGNAISYDVQVAQQAANKIKAKYPNLNIIGAVSQFKWNSQDDTTTVEYIKKCMLDKNTGHIDLLFVSYGQNKQENWIKRNSHKIPAKISIGLGGTFDYVIKERSKMFNTFQSMNIEWVYRLFTQAWRVKRIFNAVVVFPFRVFKSSL